MPTTRRGDTGTITVAANGNVKRSVGPSNYLHVFDATGLIHVELIRDNRVAEGHNIARLTTLNGRNFDQIRVIDLSGANNDVRLFYGPGDYQPNDRAEVTVDDSTPVDINIVSGSVSVNESLPIDIVPLDDVTVGVAATLIAAADAKSLYVEIAVKDDAANGIRIGDSTVTATKGRWIGPGMTAHINVQNHAIYGIRDGAADVTVTINRLDVA